MDYSNRPDIIKILASMKEQGNNVSGFYYQGTISIDGWFRDSTAEIFVAGTKEPFTFKIEISHSWGKPILYFLVKEDDLKIIDFNDRAEYVGEFTPGNLSKFIPNMEYSPNLLWALLRGYPPLWPYTRIYEKRPGAISLEGRDEKILGTIHYSPGESIIESISFHPDSLNIKFNDFQKAGDVYYAGETVLKDIKGGRDLTLIRKKIFFNRDIPDGIFTLKKPSSFKTINIEEM
ncbi:hypothetical protein ACFL1N_08910 [Thermodesulfobacteriota bacterium]